MQWRRGEQRHWMMRRITNRQRAMMLQRLEEANRRIADQGDHIGKLILYGCGDFIDDYEGIVGQEDYRDDLVLMYLATLDSETGKLARLRLVPFQIKNFRLNRPSATDAAWLRQALDREARQFNTRVEVGQAATMDLLWR